MDCSISDDVVSKVYNKSLWYLIAIFVLPLTPALVWSPLYRRALRRAKVGTALVTVHRAQGDKLRQLAIRLLKPMPEEDPMDFPVLEVAHIEDDLSEDDNGGNDGDAATTGAGALALAASAQPATNAPSSHDDASGLGKRSGGPAADGSKRGGHGDGSKRGGAADSSKRGGAADGSRRGGADGSRRPLGAPSGASSGRDLLRKVSGAPSGAPSGADGDKAPAVTDVTSGAPTGAETGDGSIGPELITFALGAGQPEAPQSPRAAAAAAAAAMKRKLRRIKTMTFDEQRAARAKAAILKSLDAKPMWRKNQNRARQQRYLGSKANKYAAASGTPTLAVSPGSANARGLPQSARSFNTKPGAQAATPSGVDAAAAAADVEAALATDDAVVEHDELELRDEELYLGALLGDEYTVQITSQVPAGEESAAEREAKREAEEAAARAAEAAVRARLAALGRGMIPKFRGVPASKAASGKGAGLYNPRGLSNRSRLLNMMATEGGSQRSMRGVRLSDAGGGSQVGSQRGKKYNAGDKREGRELPGSPPKPRMAPGSLASALELGGKNSGGSSSSDGAPGAAGSPDPVSSAELAPSPGKQLPRGFIPISASADGAAMTLGKRPPRVRVPKRLLGASSAASPAGAAKSATSAGSPPFGARSATAAGSPPFGSLGRDSGKDSAKESGKETAKSADWAMVSASEGGTPGTAYGLIKTPSLGPPAKPPRAAYLRVGSTLSKLQRLKLSREDRRLEKIMAQASRFTRLESSGGENLAMVFTNHFVVSVLCLVFFMYTIVSTSTLELFSCIAVDQLTPESKYHGRWLVHDMSQRCFVGVHRRYMLGVGIPGLMVVLGVPAYIIWVRPLARSLSCYHLRVPVCLAQEVPLVNWLTGRRRFSPLLSRRRRASSRGRDASRTPTSSPATASCSTCGPNSPRTATPLPMWCLPWRSRGLTYHTGWRPSILPQVLSLSFPALLSCNRATARALCGGARSIPQRVLHSRLSSAGRGRRLTDGILLVPSTPNREAIIMARKIGVIATTVFLVGAQRRAAHSVRMVAAHLPSRLAAVPYQK